MSRRPYGLIAEFATADALTRAARCARQAGYTRLDAYSPFPIASVIDALGCRASMLAWIPLSAALIGGVIQYFAQYWMNVVDYPLNVGGRPMHSWPAFIPSTLIVGILWAGIATFVAMLLMMRLPRLHHPVFDVSEFERASQDRFFLCIEAEDPLFDREGTARFLEELGPRKVREVPG